MQQNGHTTVSEAVNGLVACKTSQGLELRASLLRLTRHLVVFEVFDPNCVLQISEVLAHLKIELSDRAVYSGRAVVSNLVNTGTGVVCEAKLDEPWLDVDARLSAHEPDQLRREFDQFVQQWQRFYKIQPEYKVVVADIQTFLSDLRLWLERVELQLMSQPGGVRERAERAVIDGLADSVLPALRMLFEKFEESCRDIAPELRPAHSAYVQRVLHPIVLCAPFMNRTFQKPLGYAGDYEMVNMMVRDPSEGPSVFAKLLNTFFLSTPPVVAHRNRLKYLETILVQEVARVQRSGRDAKIFNLGCGPAKEVQDFLAQSGLSGRAQFTLLDFNQETISYTGNVLNDIIRRSRRSASLQMVKKGVAQVLKEAGRHQSSVFSPDYDLVYCAGLFDYLPDSVCAGLMGAFYGLLAPGGLLVATNVHTSNPSRNWMEYSVDWHLVYRDCKQMAKLIPPAAPPGSHCVLSDPSGVNTFIEIRKPNHA